MLESKESMSFTNDITVPSTASILILLAPPIPTLSRCSAPSEAFVLWPSVLRATIPLRPRFVPLCGLRSINASPHCRPLRLLASLWWLHIVFIPTSRTSLSCWHSPLRSLHGRFHLRKRYSLSFIERVPPFAP